MKFRFTIFLITFWFLTHPCYAANAIFVDLSPKSSVFWQQLKLACRFYGLDVECVAVGDSEDSHQIARTFKWSVVGAIIIAARALPVIDAHEMLCALMPERSSSVPLLILGITSQTDSGILSIWSGGAVLGCNNSTHFTHARLYRVANLKNITRQLSGQEIPFNAERVNYLILENSRNVQKITEFGNSDEEAGFPIFVKSTVAGREVFFMARIPPCDFSAETIGKFDGNRFVEMVSVMMFLRYAFAERCWHSEAHYANLTIDDPWLTEPYGHLSYAGLLKEMEKTNFHTTIAFVPWNYDRSKPEVVSLFREHSDRFSICIHGNNHDHYEFYKYETELGDPWPAKPFNVQEANIKQAIARMEKFRGLTKLSYDRVMVFPHGIAPVETLGLLKKYNFLSTVNAYNVPLGSKEPEDSLHRLRPVTLKFSNFPSLNRYTPNRSQSEIAIDLFLDNPILLFAHHDFFDNGINGFNKIAEMINNLQPDIQWRSLGCITKRLYLQKLRDDGNYDILAFSSNFVLENTDGGNVTYFVRKEESFSVPIKQVTVDGQPYPYDRSGGYLVLKVPIPMKESRHIVIEYKNNLNLASIDVSRKDLRVNLLRKLSDFRDITLSTNMLGRSLIQFYYETNLFKLGLKRLVILSIVMVFLIAYGSYYLRQRYKKRCL